MLKLNLRKGPSPVNLRRLKPWVATALFFLLVWQSITYGQKSSDIQKKQVEIDALKIRLKVLNEQKANLSPSDSFEAINGAISARNEWLKLKEKSPVHILTKLEKEKPGAAELKSLESDATRGTIKMIAGDMDTASRYMNAVFGNSNVRIAMEERVTNGILVVCSWNE